MSETHEVTITRVLPKEGKRPAKIMTEEGHEPTTFKDEIAQAATELVGKRARIEIDKQQRGEYTNVYLNKVEPIANGNEPAVATRAATAPADKASINRAVAIKAAVDAMTHTIPSSATATEVVLKVGPLAEAFNAWLNTGAWPSDNVPF